MKVGDKVRISQKSWDWCKKLLDNFSNGGESSPICTIVGTTPIGFVVDVPNRGQIVLGEPVLTVVVEEP